MSLGIYEAHQEKYVFGYMLVTSGKVCLWVDMRHIRKIMSLGIYQAHQEKYVFG